MLSKTTAITRVKTFTIHVDLVGESLDNVILSQLPKRIIVDFVDSKAFNRDRKVTHLISKTTV